MKRTILLGINEINIEYVKYYANHGYLPNFKKLLDDFGYRETTSEDKYELWEPWIQWVTIHTGLSYSEHQVFRLGDIVNRPELKQLWEIAAEEGLTVGAISPFNADNRTNKFKFFVPDPWTNAKPAGAPYLVKASKSVSQAVNDNASKKVSAESIFNLLKAMAIAIPPSRYGHYLSLLSKVKKVGTRALILDNLLADIFLHEWNKHKPEFSSLFLNTGAHFQHHYMFNSIAYQGKLKNPEWYCPSDQDPLREVLITYDKIIGELLQLNARVIVCTGLHQNPHDHVTYYWRLKNHSEFLKRIGIKNFSEILPRMSRDFLVEFKSPTEAEEAASVLSSFFSTKDHQSIFSIDNRRNSLFIELTYSDVIDKNFQISNNSQLIENFEEYVAFVAIKNGEHDGIGYYIDSGRPKPIQETAIPLSEVFHIIKGTFKKKNDVIMA